MKIDWHPNPLRTTVTLDENDLAILRLKIHIKRLEDILGDAAHHSTEGKFFDLEKVRKAVAWNTWSDEGAGAEIDRFFGYAVAELERGVHCGDCTCVPASCSKCWAEGLLGIDPIKGVGKHSLYKIDDAFRGGVDIEAAIRRLGNYKPKADWNGWEAHAPRWKNEAKSACLWLKDYRDAHFPDDGLRGGADDQARL